jgi:UDP-N-acetylglucosamine--N-acetylmuramyl-(pentapeptide) pyrophosphoryl-undecaprenol N-acetylglucosamine transferase
VVIAGGGTGGHVSPAIAVIEEFRERDVRLATLWIGSVEGFEGQAAADLNVPFESVKTGKLRRYASLQTLLDAGRIPAGVVQARRILRRFQPDVVFSTGGFVSVPTVAAARSLGIPALTHEQTAWPGLANRINARLCDTFAASFPDAPIPRLRKGARAVVTGNPVRRSLEGGAPRELQRLFGVADGAPLIYVTGGAQGAQAVNAAVAAALPELLGLAQIIHQCGPRHLNGDFSRLKARHASLPEHLTSRYTVVERVGPELAHIYAARPLVISRAGAGTVAELAHFRLPSILVPLPGATEQWHNARALQRASGAVILRQEELQPEKLTETVTSLLKDSDRGTQRPERAEVIPTTKAAARLVDELIRLAGGSAT